MERKKADIRTWPRTETGAPVLKNIDEAILYGRIIRRAEDEIAEVAMFRDFHARRMEALKAEKRPSLADMVTVAAKLELFRACLATALRKKGREEL